MGCLAVDKVSILRAKKRERKDLEITQATYVKHLKCKPVNTIENNDREKEPPGMRRREQGRIYSTRMIQQKRQSISKLIKVRVLGKHEMNRLHNAP